MFRHPALVFGIFVAIVSAAMMAHDAVLLMLERRRRRRLRGGGAFGVVVDRDGAVVGCYLDPFAHPWRAARIHEPGSPWSPPLRFGEHAYAWEGFGETEEDARLAANRLRRRHLQLLPLIDGLDGDGETGDPPPPWAAA